MPYIPPRGNPLSKLWIILQAPFASDIPKLSMLSGGMGLVLAKMFSEAGMNLNDYYICARCPDTDDPKMFSAVEPGLAQFMPPFIIVVGDAAGAFLPELREKDSIATSAGQLQKYAGSLLECSKLSYPHYMMPIYGPDKCIADWTERNVTTYVDLQKLKDEIEYWKKYGKIQPLKARTLVYGDLSIEEILQSFERFRRAKLLSIDIETVYPREKSAYYPHPGLPITIGSGRQLATLGSPSTYSVISPRENRILWRELE
jgi:uracil-DNA glycosylase